LDQAVMLVNVFGGARFESRLGYWICWLNTFREFFNSSRNIIKLGYNQFLSGLLKFITSLSTNCNTLFPLSYY
jgi:hypothetical protein